MVSERRYSEDTASQIDRAIRQLVAQALERAADILQQKRPTLEVGAQKLLQQETLVEQDLRLLLASG
jgi:cell division protease FtsH